MQVSDGQSHKPVVGVTSPIKGAWPSWFFTKLLVKRAGGKAVRLVPGKPRPRDRLDALIFGGGANIDPLRYREKVIQTIRKEAKQESTWDRFFLLDLSIWLLRKVFSLEFTTQSEDLERDTFEFRLLEEARNARIPVLGICRGAQLINVFHGGSLYEDLADFYVEQPQLRTVFPRVKISIEAGSRLREILNHDQTHVNALHHQSVKELGRGLKVTAKTSNGIVQAVESTGKEFVVGVQWHPEFLPFRESQRRLFRTLIEEARHSPTQLEL